MRSYASRKPTADGFASLTVLARDQKLFKIKNSIPDQIYKEFNINPVKRHLFAKVSLADKEGLTYIYIPDAFLSSFVCLFLNLPRTHAV